MPREDGQWKPGQSGNPNGAPRRGKSLAEILERAGSKTIQAGDRRVVCNRFVAELVWQAAATGQVDLPDGRILKVRDLADWWELIKFLYPYLSPPQNKMDVTSAGQPIGFVVKWEDGKPGIRDTSAETTQ